MLTHWRLFKTIDNYQNKIQLHVYLRCIHFNIVLKALRVPTHTGKTGKPGKMREVSPVREKSGNFRISPESQGIFYQSGKSQGKLDQKIILIFMGKV